MGSPPARPPERGGRGAACALGKKEWWAWAWACLPLVYIYIYVIRSFHQHANSTLPKTTSYPFTQFKSTLIFPFIFCSETFFKIYWKFRSLSRSPAGSRGAGDQSGTIMWPKVSPKTLAHTSKNSHVDQKVYKLFVKFYMQTKMVCILVAFWSQFGLTLVPCWSHFGSSKQHILVHILVPLGMIHICFACPLDLVIVCWFVVSLCTFV